MSFQCVVEFVKTMAILVAFCLILAERFVLALEPQPAAIRPASEQSSVGQLPPIESSRARIEDAGVRDTRSKSFRLAVSLQAGEEEQCDLLEWVIGQLTETGCGPNGKAGNRSP